MQESKRKQRISQERGITLVALVITIVIIIILATVTINFAFGQGGLIRQAENARDYYENDTKYTEESLSNVTAYLNEVLSGSGNPTVPEEKPAYVDSSLPTAPEVADGMIPVKYVDGTGWVRTTKADEEWYDYGNKEWANVVLSEAQWNDTQLDGQTLQVLNEDEPYSMLVWIPRYAYQITSQYHQNGTGAGNINIVFIDTNNQDKEKTTTYKETYPSASTGSGMSDYVVHPAFNYGTTKLSGFWVGKFETSNTSGYGNDSSTANNTNLTLQIKAEETSWRNITVNNMFTVCISMNKRENPYGLSSDDTAVDPHMMKNSEWGAVAYLSQNETYGKGSEVWINNNTSYITGRAGTSVSQENDEIGAGTYKYTTTNGQQASTTGNVTGAYDMSGLAWECTAAYVNNGSSNINSYGETLANANERYRDVYRSESSSGSSSQSTDYNYTQPITGLGQPTATSGHYGDAVWETTNTPHDSNNGSWYNNYVSIPYSDSPFFARNGGNGYGATAGIFCFGNYDGSTRGAFGFRVVVPVL